MVVLVFSAQYNRIGDGSHFRLQVYSTQMRADVLPALKVHLHHKIKVLTDILLFC